MLARSDILRWTRRAGFALAGLFVLLVVLLAVLRLAAMTPPGHWLARSLIEGRTLGSAGQAQIEGLRGDLLSRVRIDRLRLTDADGVWLEAENVELDWHGRTVLFGPLRIDRAEAAQVSVLRRPAGADAPAAAETGEQGETGSAPALTIEHVSIDALVLSRGVMGPAGTYALEGNLSWLAPGRNELALTLVSTDTDADRLEARFSDGGGRLAGRITARGEAQGLLANLVRLPDERVELEAALTGTPAAGSGDFVLRSGGEERAAGEGDWTDGQWQIRATADINHWRLLPDALQPLTEAASLDASGTTNPGLSLARLSVESRGGRLEMRAQDAPGWQAEISLEPDVVSGLSGARIDLDAVNWSGTIRRDGGLDLTGRIVLENMAVGSVTSPRVAGRFDMSRGSGAYAVETELDITAPQTGQADTDRLLGDAAQLTARLAWLSATRTLRIDGLDLQADTLSLTASGEWGTRTGIPVLTGELALQDLALVTGLAHGPARLTARTAGPGRIEANLDASEAVWAENFASTLSGLSAAAQLEQAEGSWLIRNLTADASGLRLEADGEVTTASDWQMAGNLALLGALPVTALELGGGIATAFESEAGANGIRLRTTTSTDRLGAGPVGLARPRLDADTQIAGDTIRSDWTLEAFHDGEPVRLNGHLDRRDGVLELSIPEGRVGRSSLEAGLVQDAETLNVELGIAQGDAPVLDASFSAPRTALMAGELTASLHLADQLRGNAYLEEARIELNGPLSAMSLRASGAGRLSSRVDLVGSGQVSVARDGVAVRFSPAGKWSIHDWRAAEPLEFRAGADGIRATGALTMDGGEFYALFDTVAEAPRAEFRISALPASLASDIAQLPLLRGSLTGEGRFGLADGHWTGQARLEGTGIADIDRPDMDTLTVGLTLDLDADEARAALTATGGGLQAAGQVRRQGPTRSFAELAGPEDAPIEGRLTASGDAASLANLFLPLETRMEAGGIDADIRLAGTRSSPGIDGRLSLQDGRVVARTSGSVIDGLAIDAELDEETLSVVRFAATDAREGRISGEGEWRLDGAVRDGRGRLEFDRFVAAHRSDLTLQASGHADLQLDAEGLGIRGEADLVQLRIRPAMNGASSIPNLDVEEINLPKGRQTERRESLPIRLDYRVRADDGIHVNSRAFATEWGLDLHVTGPSAKPSLFGSADLLNGSAFVFSRRFTMEDGSVTFDGAPDDARLDLTAVHRRTGFAATARLTGRANAPRVTLSSDPSLPEDEILSRLLFDQSVSQLGALEAAQLAAQLSGQDVLDVAGQLREFTGIDRLDLSSNDDGSVSVTGGRRFGDDIYVEVGTAGTAAIDEALVDWSLTPDLSLLSRLRADTDASISLRWRRDY